MKDTKGSEARPAAGARSEARSPEARPPEAKPGPKIEIRRLPLKPRQMPKG